MIRKFYCTHSFEFWEKIQDEKWFVCDKKYYMFPKCYKWLIKQMKKRIPDYNKEDGLIWLWPFRPDLRKTGYGEPGEKMVLLEIEIDDMKVLGSDFSAWHCILNNGPILTEEEAKNSFDEFDDDKIKKEKTWDRVFDINFCKENGYNDEDSLQYTTGKVPMSKVKLLKIFKAK